MGGVIHIHLHVQACDHFRQSPHPGNIHRPPGQQGVAPYQRRPPHTADMALEVPLSHELRHHHLGAHFRMSHHQRAAAGKRLHQLPWQHQVTQAQRRKRHLAEGADIQHPAATVQRRQRSQGRAAVAVLAVVVILDDPAIVALGPGQQFQATGQAHHHAGGVLVGWRDIGHAAIAHAGQCGAIQPIVIHSHAMYRRPGQGEGASGRPIAWVFHSHGRPRLQQQLCTKAYRLLCAGGDHNLFRRTGKSARSTQIGRDEFPQQRFPGRIAVTQRRHPGISPETRLQLGPDLEREQIVSRHADAKCPWRPTSWRRQMMGFQAKKRRCVDNFTGRITSIFSRKCG